MTEMCSDCGIVAPETKTRYSLIGASWRLTRDEAMDGSYAMNWHCPACWATLKQKAEREESVAALAPPAPRAKPKAR